MRKIYFLMILAGLVAAFGYPWYVYNLTGFEIGTFTAYRQTSGFIPVSVILSQDQTPVRIFVDIKPIKGYYPEQARTILTITASTSGQTVLTSTLNFVASSEESRSLQTTEKVFRDRAGDLIIQQAGEYKFVLGEGDVDGLSLKQANIVLRANATEADPRAQPIGFALLALGALGFIRSRKKKNTPTEAQPAAPTPPKEPEKPKWGRDAADE